MYCPYCHAEVAPDTTICSNCGKTFIIKSSEQKCSQCGYIGAMKKYNVSLTTTDWVIIILLFPLSILYYLWIKQFRAKQTFLKCPRCKHKEKC